MVKTAIATPDDDDERSQLAARFDLDNLSNEQIVSLFQGTLDAIFLKISEAAFLLMALEKRGYDTSKLRRIPIVEAVRNVGLGILAKEAFTAFYGRPIILRTLTALPIEEQRRLTDDGTVPVYDRVKGGDHLRIDIDQLSPQEISLVFDTKNHRVRSPEEQSKILASSRVREGLRRAKISHDPRTGVITAIDATADEIRAYMKKHGL